MDSEPEDSQLVLPGQYIGATMSVDPPLPNATTEALNPSPTPPERSPRHHQAPTRFPAPVSTRRKKLKPPSSIFPPSFHPLSSPHRQTNSTKRLVISPPHSSSSTPVARAPIHPNRELPSPSFQGHQGPQPHTPAAGLVDNVSIPLTTTPGGVLVPQSNMHNDHGEIRVAPVPVVKVGGLTVEEAQGIAIVESCVPGCSPTLEDPFLESNPTSTSPVRFYRLIFLHRLMRKIDANYPTTTFPSDPRR